MVISQEYADVPVGDRAMRTFVAAPRAPGRYPGVVFYSDIFQLTESTLRWCARLAGYGFVVAAPEIYHRIEPAGTVLGFDDEGKRRGQADADADARRRLRRRHPRRARLAGGRRPRRGRRLCATGYCIGGHLAFRAAFEPGVRATALLVPDRPARRQAGQGRRRGLARARAARSAARCCWSSAPTTRTPPTRAVRSSSAGLEEAGVSFRWSLYEAEHAFMRDIGPRYDPEATDAAFAETVAVLKP